MNEKLIERRTLVKWEFCLLDEHTAISKENSPPLFCIDEPIAIWVEGELKFDEVKLIPIWDEVEPFIHVTLDSSGRLRNYLC